MCIHIYIYIHIYMYIHTYIYVYMDPSGRQRHVMGPLLKKRVMGPLLKDVSRVSPTQRRVMGIR